MHTAWIIAKREYKRYFATPAAYVIAFFFLLIIGYLFYTNLITALFNQFTPGIDVVLGPLVFLLLFTTPAITMRLIAEEQRAGTLELMLTAPVRDWELVTGKWLGGTLFLLTLIAVTWVYPAVLDQMIDPGIDQGPLLTGYLGVALVTAALVAVGVTISSFFSNQIVAFFATLGVLLLLWIFSAPTSAFGNELMAYLDFRTHFFTNFFVGVIDLRDVIYYLSITALSLFLGSVFVETRRWR